MKVKMTHEMVDAGMRALGQNKGAVTRDQVCKVWCAMAAACPPIKVQIPPGVTLTSIVIQLS